MPSLKTIHPGVLELSCPGTHTHTGENITFLPKVIKVKSKVGRPGSPVYSSGRSVMLFPWLVVQCGAPLLAFLELIPPPTKVRYPFTPGWSEEIRVKCLSQGHNVGTYGTGIRTRNLLVASRIA